MKVIETEIAGVKIIEPDVFGDARGWFCESYNAERYRRFGIENVFVQDNESFSAKGVVRGLHWQAAPHTQAIRIRRKNSPYCQKENCFAMFSASVMGIASLPRSL